MEDLDECLFCVGTDTGARIANSYTQANCESESRQGRWLVDTTQAWSCLVFDEETDRTGSKM